MPGTVHKQLWPKLCFHVGLLPREWAQMPLQILNLSDNFLTGVLISLDPQNQTASVHLVHCLARDAHYQHMIVQCKLVHDVWQKLLRWPRHLLCCTPLSSCLKLHAGTLPAEWLASGSLLADNVYHLDLSNNRLHGSIPTAMGGNFLAGSSNSLWAASAVLSPMIEGFGLCGAVPNNTNITARDMRPLTGGQPWKPCPAGVRAACAQHARHALVTQCVCALPPAVQGQGQNRFS